MSRPARELSSLRHAVRLDASRRPAPQRNVPYSPPLTSFRRHTSRRSAPPCTTSRRIAAQRNVLFPPRLTRSHRYASLYSSALHRTLPRTAARRAAWPRSAARFIATRRPRRATQRFAPLRHHLAPQRNATSHARHRATSFRRSTLPCGAAQRLAPHRHTAPRIAPRRNATSYVRARATSFHRPATLYASPQRTATRRFTTQHGSALYTAAHRCAPPCIATPLLPGRFRSFAASLRPAVRGCAARRCATRRDVLARPTERVSTAARHAASRRPAIHHRTPQYAATLCVATQRPFNRMTLGGRR
jgi:hypothetical protein